ncbi:MAG TPA: adenylosuccinate lyase [Clostridia bacterium]|nr:adenylosuccinate lyase [Clostridia bacterium]
MYNTFQNPFETRYSSEEMKTLFSQDTKFGLWRRLWLALATAEKKLGLPITDEQLDEMKLHLEDINYDVAIAREAEVHHDVMAHIYAFGVQCPKAKPIIHLGATSCFVGDNADLIIMFRALEIVKKEIAEVAEILAQKALLYADLPTLAFTHLQPAQLTTVGKRLTLYLQDLTMDLEAILELLKSYKLRGVKGTTGTQASFAKLFDNNENKIFELDKMVAKELGFENTFSVTGQTYPRKFDYKILSVLSGVAQSCAKFANDMRILQSKNEMQEPFSKSQVGSSAMAYKRNPILAERICALSRYNISLPVNCAMTSSVQWLERTLDDSANRRIVIAESFLSIDAILLLMKKIVSGLVVNENVIKLHIEAELPFMATENLLMKCVKEGGDRQVLHEVIRFHSIEVTKEQNEKGTENNLFERLKGDKAFEAFLDCFDNKIDSREYTGISAVQTIKFVNEEVLPLLAKLNRGER